ncbi:MAG: exo-alpha-sialidase, partial [Dehalococcoidia bacterium]
MGERARLLVGTRKGAFIYTADAQRQAWETSEPLMPGWTVSHMAADTRHDPPRLYAAASHWAWGPSVARSDDVGKTWEQRSPG